MKKITKKQAIIATVLGSVVAVGATTGVVAYQKYGK